MKFEILNVEMASDPVSFIPIKILKIKYSHNDALRDASLVSKKITSQDDYDLMVGREFRMAMGEFLAKGGIVN